MDLGSYLCYLDVATDTFYYRLYDISMEFFICLCFDFVYIIQDHRWIAIGPGRKTDMCNVLTEFLFDALMG